MIRLGSIVLLVFLLLCISGCDTDPVFAASWDEMVGFYESNYPDCTPNQKALMLAETMEKEGQKGTVVRKKYEVEIIYVYDGRGTQQWPTKQAEEFDKRNGLERFADTIKELENKPKVEVETND